MTPKIDDRLAEVISMTREYLTGVQRDASGTVRVSREVADELDSLAVATSLEQIREGAVREETETLDTVAELAELEKTVSTCTLCKLSETRKHTVFGAGSPHAGGVQLRPVLLFAGDEV